MLFYIKCPTCSRVISIKLDQYRDKLDAIVNDPNKTKTQKEEESSRLLDEFGYKHMCCRIRIMGMIPAHKIIS